MTERSDFSTTGGTLGSAVPPRLQCHGIGKRFGAARALADVDLQLRGGQIHGIVGSNGAGKSTLMKILSGSLPDHEGSITLDGRPARLASPHQALAAGVAMVYQELSGIGALSVAENVCLGRQPLTRWGRIDWPRIRRDAEAALAELDLNIDVRRRLDSYPLSVRQLVEIARGLHSGARVLIFDEPTSALSPPETRRLLELMVQLRQRDVAVVFISHFLEEVLEVCDQVTVLRDGRHVLTAPAAQLDKSALVAAMLGHPPPAAAGRQRVVGDVAACASVLIATELSLRGAFHDISLHVAPGECLGVYGFVGAGHQELAHTLAGALRPQQGTVRIDDWPLPPGDIRAAIGRGVVLVAADRAASVFPRHEVAHNVTIAHLRQVLGGWLTRTRERAVVRPLLEQVGCRPPNPDLLAGQLSGGNQQKTVLARWLLGPIRVLVLDEPTRGMDVAAKEEIMQLVAQLRARGTAVVLCSSEPELVLEHATRILVLRKGRPTRELAVGTIGKNDLVESA